MKPFVEKRQVVFDKDCVNFLSFFLKIVEYGTVKTDTIDDYGEKFIHLHRLNYIVSGTPYYDYHGQKIELDSGSVVYLAPNERLGVEEGECVELMFINFRLGAVDKTLQFSEFVNSLFPYNHVHDSDGTVKNMFDTLFKIGKENKKASALEMQNFFENIFLHIIRKSTTYYAHEDTQQIKGTDQFFNAAIRYINDNIYNNLKIHDIAKHLHISDNYLYKIFMDKIGRSPSAFISDYKIEEARRYLEDTDATIKEIAARLGYNNNAHFSAVFKNATGLPPAQYRKKYKPSNAIVI